MRRRSLRKTRAFSSAVLAGLAAHFAHVENHLLKTVWGPGHAHDTHYVRVHMANLRKKVEGLLAGALQSSRPTHTI